MVGYVKDSTAVVDEMFQTDELSRYLARMNLAPQWEEGVFDRLTAGEVPGEELGQPQKGCRIWQLRKDVDVTMRFIGYEDLVKKFGEPWPATIPRYSKGIWEPMIWSGSMPSAGIALLPDTGDIRMALSDVVELYDASGSEFYYCDRVGFRPIQFSQSQEQAECIEMTMVGRTFAHRPAFTLSGRSRSPPAIRKTVTEPTSSSHPQTIKIDLLTGGIFHEEAV